MISWIQKYFQHHFRTVFAVLLAVIIIAFVFTIGAQGSAMRRDHGGLVDRHFFGYNLSLASDTQRLIGEAELSAALQFGMFGGFPQEQIQQYAFTRAAALHLAEQWHIPAATDPEITDAVKKLRMFAGQDGQFDAKAYATFRDNLKTNPRGLKEADIRRVISDDVRVEKVNKLLAGPGYVLPADVKQQLGRFETSWTLGTVTADYAGFKVDAKPTDAELAKWFEESGGRYDVPPRVSASYVEFPAANYVAQVKVTDAEVRAFYDANPSRFPKADAKPATPNVTPPAADANADFAAVRPKVEEALKLERARQLAAKAASDFALALFNAKTGNPKFSLEQFLAAQKVAPKPLAPFTREAGPAELGGSPEAADAAFRLNAQQPSSDAVATANGYAILFWKETIPARKPLLSEVRERVAADYLENEKRKRFVELGRTIKSQLEARLKAGDSLEKAAAAVNAGGVKLEAKTLPAFTLRSRPQDLDYSVLGALERLERGQVSDMIITADKGIFVYAADKKAPDMNEASPAYTEARNQLASLTGRIGAQAYISELVEQELKRSEPKPQ